MGNVIIVGDLNIILNQEEKRGGMVVKDPIREHVYELIMDWGLSDIIPAKGKFTWTSKRLGPWHIVARLDRFLVQDSFLLLGLNASSKILVFGGSDHKPIMLELRKDQNLDPIPFHLNPFWIYPKDFMGTVVDAWKAPAMSSPFFIWEQNLCITKKALKKWAKTLETPSQKKHQAMLRLEARQLVMETNQIVEEDQRIEVKSQQELHDACR